MQKDPSDPPTYDQLMALYKVAVDEYRFQVNLNAQRSRDYFVLNSAIIASAVALLGQKANLLAGAVFLAGLLVAVLTGFGFHTQHNYYRETRATKRLLETRLGIGETVVKTTPSTGSRRRRLGSVTRFNYVIVALLCLVNISGFLFCFSILPLPTRKPEAASRTIKTLPSPIPVPITPAGPPAPGKKSP